jgi:hypothetical protein
MAIVKPTELTWNVPLYPRPRSTGLIVAHMRPKPIWWFIRRKKNLQKKCTDDGSLQAFPKPEDCLNGSQCTKEIDTELEGRKSFNFCY